MIPQRLKQTTPLPVRVRYPFRAMRGYYSPQLVGAAGDDPAVSVLPPCAVAA